MKLTETAKDLNRSTDNLTSLIKRAEDVLAKLRLGVSAWVKFDSPDPRFSLFGYAKYKNAWHLVVDDGGGSTLVRLTDAPRIVRLKAIEKIVILFDELKAEAVALSELTDASVDSLQSFIELREKEVQNGRQGDDIS